MIRKILVGLDGSDFSVSAVDLGIGWARHFGAQLVGLGIVGDEDRVAGQSRTALPLSLTRFRWPWMTE